MAKAETTEVSTWLAKMSLSSLSEILLHVRGVPFTLNRELLASRSAKVAAILRENPGEKDLTYFFQDVPSDAETFELMARFCHGFELQITIANVVPLMCLAFYMGMTETHSPGNLLTKTVTFFKKKILPSWNETIKAFQVAENYLQLAFEIGLIDACLDSIIGKVVMDPRLLGTPLQNNFMFDDSEDSDDEYRPNARRKLFDDSQEVKSEDLTAISLQLYEHVIRVMNQRGVPLEYLASSICQYGKRWVFLSPVGGETEMVSVYKRNSRRDVIEVVEKILPDERGLIPCSLLFEFLRYAISLEATSECRAGFEMRIGKQLDQATVQDLLIPSQGYAKEIQYDIECFRRILKIFYGNYSDSNAIGLIKVAELIKEFLLEVASDIDLRVDSFVSLAEMFESASYGIQKNSDGLYRAIDAYLGKHRYLTESEREEVCKVLDCHKLSPEACEHAAKNEKLPLRVVVQVLFVAQLQLRDAITKEMQICDVKSPKEEENEDEKVREEMVVVSNKVMELERECSIIKKEIEKTCSCNSYNNSSGIYNNKGIKKGKISVWREMKRKFGCMSAINHDCNCNQIRKKKKVHPRFGV